MDYDGAMAPGFQTAIRLPLDMLERIDAIASKHGLSRSEALRRCVDEGLPIVEAILAAEEKARDAARRKALGK